MESRLRVFLLNSIGTMVLALGLPAFTSAAEATAGQSVSQSQQQSDAEIIQQDPVIQPDVKRREVTENDINTENFQIEVYTGLLSIEDFGTSSTYGIRLDYHISEDLFLQGAIGQGRAGTTSFDRLGGGPGLLSDTGRDYLFYNFSLGYNLLPGESYLTRDSAYNSALYLIAGAGNTQFADDDHFTITWGGGYVLTANGWLAVHMDFRDHMFNISVTGEDKVTHNFEASLGLAYYF